MRATARRSRTARSEPKEWAAQVGWRLERIGEGVPLVGDGPEFSELRITMEGVAQLGRWDGDEVELMRDLFGHGPRRAMALVNERAPGKVALVGEEGPALATRRRSAPTDRLAR